MNKYKASLKQTLFSIHKVPFRIKQKELDKMIMIDYHRNTTQDEDASNSANNEVVMQTMNEFVLTTDESC